MTVALIALCRNGWLLNHVNNSRPRARIERNCTSVSASNGCAAAYARAWANSSGWMCIAHSSLDVAHMVRQPGRQTAADAVGPSVRYGPCES